MIARTSITSLLTRSAFVACLSAMAFGVAKAQPVRGLYVAGAAGASFNQSQTVNPHTKLFAHGRDDFATGITGLGSIGWGLGDGFRVELEGNYRNNRLSRFHSPGFSSTAHGHQQKYGGMANALFDMDIGQNWIYPYFGAGIGYGNQFTNTRIQGTGADKGYKQRTRDSAGGFAYQGIFGLSLPVPWVVGLSTTMEYRFYTITGRHRHYTVASYNIANPESGPVGGKRGSRTDFNHSLMLGLRYEFNPAPPPPAPKPTLSTPAPAPVRTYLVFFDWDRDSLSDRARAIVETAARSSTSAQFTRIQVNGHADSSAAHPGSKKAQAYNMALSLRRAQAVKAELIRDGVPAGVIDVHGFGDSRPLVATRPGKAEAQNRRVEIDFQ
ncbi:OmpA family protein [Acetobacteraceae bacterium B3987]|nr:OmpA family protein [Acetobacteraceae bacterium B3987]